MRSKALSFLLSLSLMFCVGFGSSLTAYATNLPLSSVPFANISYPEMRFRASYGSWYDLLSANYDSDEYYTNFTNTSVFSNVSEFFYAFSSNTAGFEYAYNFEVFDYYLAFNFMSYGNNYRDSNFDIRYLRLDGYDIDGNYTNSVLSTVYVNSFSQRSAKGFSVLARIPDNLVLNNSTAITVKSESSTVLAFPANISAFVYQVPKGVSEDDVSSIIEAINQQTSDIQQSIDNRTSDIQQSIQDQYSGNPDQSFGVDDIITQHNEKMGVLSFGSDTLMQVLGLLSPDQSLSSELVFPSMSLTVAGQRNKVQLWPEYRFDLNELKLHWPDFVGLMQSLTTALVWIFVLRYCYLVFEKYFLAGGGN